MADPGSISIEIYDDIDEGRPPSPSPYQYSPANSSYTYTAITTTTSSTTSNISSSIDDRLNTDHYGLPEPTPTPIPFSTTSSSLSSSSSSSSLLSGSETVPVTDTVTVTGVAQCVVPPLETNKKASIGSKIGSSSASDKSPPRLLRASSAPTESVLITGGQHFVIEVTDKDILHHPPKLSYNHYNNNDSSTTSSACGGGGGGGGSASLSNSPTSLPNPITRTHSDPTSNRKPAAKIATPAPAVTFMQSIKRGLFSLYNSSRRNSTSGELTPRAMMMLANVEKSAKVYETFYCNICCENIKKERNKETGKRTWCIGCDNEDHIFCRDCLEQWCQTQINDGVVHLHCPEYNKCHSELSVSLISDVLDEKFLTKFEHLKKVRLNPSFRDCPSCGHGCSTGSVAAPEITCEKCNTMYCFVHNNAHLGKTCEQYTATLSTRVLQDLQASENLIKNGTKTCPQCKSPTEKNGGCNHMTCRFCKADWCWVCNQVLPNVHDHFNGTLSACNGLQFTDARWIDQGAHCVRLLQILRFLLTIVDYIVVLLPVCLGSLCIFLAYWCSFGLLFGLIPWLFHKIDVRFDIGICTESCFDKIWSCQESFNNIFMFVCGASMILPIWLSSLGIIIGPLLLYLLLLLSINTIGGGDYSWDELKDATLVSIFHVPIFVASVFNQD